MAGIICRVVATCLAVTLVVAPASAEQKDDSEQPAENQAENKLDVPTDGKPDASGEEADSTDTLDERAPFSPPDALKKAEQDLAEGRIGEAYALFASVAEQEEDKDAAAKAAEHLKQILVNGKKEIKAALALNDPTQAAGRLTAIYVRYRATPVTELLAEARRFIRVRLAQQALAKDDKAKEGAEEEGEEPPDDDETKAWLIIGDIHRLNGRTDEAREAYNVLIYEYPESRFTEQARNRLEELQGDEAAQDAGGSK